MKRNSSYMHLLLEKSREAQENVYRAMTQLEGKSPRFAKILVEEVFPLDELVLELRDSIDGEWLPEVDSGAPLAG